MRRSVQRSLPQHLLRDPEIKKALASRRFSAVFAAAKAAGMSYYAIGDAIGVKSERVAEVARGRGTITGIDTVERIADGLRIPGAMLGLATRHWEYDQPALAAREEDPMERRKLLRGALAAGAVMPLTSLADVRKDIDQALAYSGAQDVTAVEAAAERHSRGYHGRDPDDVLADLVNEMAQAVHLLKQHHPKSVRNDLARAIGQIGGLTAIVLHDQGRGDEALRWFATAAEATKQAGDRKLHAWILARRAMVPLNYGAPQVAARIAEQSRRAAGASTSAAAALAASVAARAYALSDQPAEAVAALRDADRIAGLLSSAESSGTWLGYSPQKHQVHRSQALTQLGDSRAARESQDAGLSLTTPAGMTYTLLLLDAAICLHRDGDSTGACDTAADVLIRAPQRYRTGLVWQRGVELYRDVPDQTQKSSAGRHLSTVLHEMQSA